MFLKNIISTAGTRLLNALFSLVILLLITNFIGSKGLGEISLIMVDITITQLLIDWMAGSALVYFASRTETANLLIPAYLWILAVIIFFGLIGVFFYLFFPALLFLVVPRGYETIILLLALLNAFMQTHYNLLIGQGRIRTYNILFSFQITSTILFFSLFLLVLHQLSPLSYVEALAIAWGLSGLFGFYQIIKNIKRISLNNWRSLSRDIFHYGLQTQLSNILHIGNKRLSFYFIRAFSGLSSLGIYSAGIQLTEGLRLIGQSISLVQFSAISSSRDHEFARILTIRLMKFSVSLSLLALIILLVIPQSLYQSMFGSSFGAIKSILVVLSPGVLALASNAIFSHYFSGTGQPKVNVRANVAGFIITVVFLILLIPRWGYLGAASTASLSYISVVVYQAVIFKKQTKTRWQEWLVNKTDFIELKKLFVQLTAKATQSKHPS